MGISYAQSAGVALAVGAACVGIDQATKHAARRQPELNPLPTRWYGIATSRDEWSARGAAPARHPLGTVVPGAIALTTVSLGLAFAPRSGASGVAVAASAGAVATGVASNAFDRARAGYVTNVAYLPGGRAYNVADVAIGAGIVGGLGSAVLAAVLAAVARRRV